MFTHKDTKVSPSVTVLDLQTLVERLADPVLTVLAVGRRLGVVDVPSRDVGKEAGVLVAGLATGWREYVEFVVLAVDRLVVQDSGDQTADKAGEGVLRRQACLGFETYQLVHPHSPKVWQSAGGRSDTAEQGQEDQQERVEQCRNDDTWR